MAEWWIAAVVGAGLMLLCNQIIPPATAPFPGHGERFAAMAVDPFAFVGEFPQRILWPMLAWLFGQFGVGVVAFSSVCSGALLATVFWFARRRSNSVLDALLVATAIAASGAVLVYQPMRCFSDTLNLLLLVLLLHFAARPAVYWSLVLVAAFSHELVFFFTPWLIYLRLQNGGTLRTEAARWAACIAAYGSFRLVLKLTGHTGPYDMAYYFKSAIWVPWALPAIWLLWGFVVLVEFGPLLCSLFFAGRIGALSQPSGMGGRLWPWLYWPSLLSLMLLAYDVMRFAPLVLPPVLLALLALAARAGGRMRLVVLIALQVGCYLWLHPIASEQGGRHFTEMTGSVLASIDQLASRQPGNAVSFMWQLLVQFWHFALVALLALVAMVLFGRRMAKGCYAAPQPISPHSHPQP